METSWGYSEPCWWSIYDENINHQDFYLRYKIEVIFYVSECQWENSAYSDMVYESRKQFQTMKIARK